MWVLSVYVLREDTTHLKTPNQIVSKNVFTINILSSDIVKYIQIIKTFGIQKWLFIADGCVISVISDICCYQGTVTSYLVSQCNIHTA